METAFVGIVGALIGILLTNVLRVYFAWRNRHERVRDLQAAIRAEIRGYRHALEYFDDTESVAAIDERIAQDQDYTPFVPQEVEPPVFSAILGEIHVLPASVIDPVVLFYRQIRIVGALAQDMRQASFRSVRAEFKIEMFRDYIALGAYALQLGDEALMAIERPSSPGRIVNMRAWVRLVPLAAWPPSAFGPGDAARAWELARVWLWSRWSLGQYSPLDGDFQI